MPLRKDILALKKCLEQKRKQDASLHTVAKTSLFEVPAQFWLSGLDTFFFKEYPHKAISFSNFAKNRDNYEYVKEFNKLNGYQPTYLLKHAITGDLFQVNKGFVMGMTDDEEEEEEGNKFSFLADGAEFAAGDIDFSDPTALLRRQKAILEAIHKHMT